MRHSQFALVALFVPLAACRATQPLGGPADAAQVDRLLQPQGLLQGQAAPPPAPGTLRLAVIGDYGIGSPEEAAVARLVASWSPEAVITTGDNAYPDAGGDRLDLYVGALFGQFAGAVRGGVPPAQRRFFPTPGNHDWRTQQKLQPYLDYFHPPGNGRYYDATLGEGRVQLFALDSDPHEPDGIGPQSAQARWLEPRLRASTACLKLVAFHHPPWSSSQHGSNPELRWPFHAWGADALLAGHDHVYERLEADGLVLFISGLGGAEVYPFKQPLPESRVRWNQRHGALLITVGEAQSSFDFWSVAGEKVDSWVLERRCPLPGAARSPADGG